MSISGEEYRREHLSNNDFTIEPLANGDIDKLKPILKIHAQGEETEELIRTEIDEI